MIVQVFFLLEIMDHINRYMHNCIRRRNIHDAAKIVIANEDFILAIVEAHVIIITLKTSRPFYIQSRMILL